MSMSLSFMTRVMLPQRAPGGGALGQWYTEGYALRTVLLGRKGLVDGVQGITANSAQIG